MNLWAEVFRIVEESYKTDDDSYIWELCVQAEKKYKYLTAAEIFYKARQHPYKPV